MNTAEIIFAAMAALSPIVSVVISLLAFKRNQDKDNKADGQQEGVLQSDVGYIKSGVDRLEKRLDKIDEKQDSFSQRLIKLETVVEEHIKDTSIHKK